MKKLRDVQVGWDEVIDTYDRGTELFSDYAQVTKLLERGCAPAEIGKILGSKKYSNRARSILDRGVMPKCVSGACNLSERGLLPMNQKNPKLPLLNMVTSAALWNGSIAPHASTSTGTSNVITVQNVDQLKNVDQLLDELGGHYEFSPYNDHNGDERYRMLFDQRLSRLIRTLGWPEGKRRDKVSHVPSHLQSAFRTFNDSRATHKERQLAYNLMRDFILTLLYFRLSVTTKREFNVNLMGSGTEKISKRESDYIGKMANTVFMPKVSFRKTDSTIDNHKNYHGILKAKGLDSRRSIETQYRKRVKEVISLSRQGN